MAKSKYVKIITDIEAFSERTDELVGDVSYEEVKQTIADIKKALYDNSDVPALCAPQIGSKLRLFVVRTAKSESQRFKVFLNPIIISSEGLHLSREKNASFENKEFIIPRSDKVHVAYQETDGKPNSETFIGAYGEVVQQMIEMLDGITLADTALDLDDVGGPEEFDAASKKDKQTIISMYLENLKQTHDDIAKEIEETPELKNLNDTIEFMKGMLTGDITPIKDVETTKKIEG